MTDKKICRKCHLELNEQDCSNWDIAYDEDTEPWISCCPGSLEFLEQYPTFASHWFSIEDKDDRMDFKYDYHEPMDWFLLLMHEAAGVDVRS